MRANSPRNIFVNNRSTNFSKLLDNIEQTFNSKSQFGGPRFKGSGLLLKIVLTYLRLDFDACLRFDYTCQAFPSRP